MNVQEKQPNVPQMNDRCYVCKTSSGLTLSNLSLQSVSLRHVLHWIHASALVTEG